MKEYNFEYTRQAFTYLLFIFSFSIIGLGLALYRLAAKQLMSPGLVTIILIVLAVAFFLINKHRIKRIGIARLSDASIIFELNQTTEIPFNNIKYYYIYNGKNGMVFTLGLNNGTKFKLSANNNFSNVDLLKTFLVDFQTELEIYNAQNNANIIHLETIFARKGALWILIVLTILVIIGFCFTKMPIMILSIGLSTSLLVGWIRYFQQKSKNKLVDF